MKTVGFIGGYDKIDFLLYISRILTLAQKRVLLIDATILQKARYVIPAINPTQSYVTEFEGFDVAVGFKNIDEIKHYLGNDKKALEYDIILIDIDNAEMAKNFEIEKNNQNCFITAFDLYSLKKGIEILNIFDNPVKMTKVLFSRYSLKEENEYLDYLSLGSKVNWDDEILNFPIELGNYSVMVENQIISRIKIKKLSEHYKDSLEYFITIIFNEDISPNEVKKIIKTMEKES